MSRPELWPYKLFVHLIYKYGTDIISFSTAEVAVSLGLQSARLRVYIGRLAELGLVRKVQFRYGTCILEIRPIR
jgi:hypothetical protein